MQIESELVSASLKVLQTNRVAIFIVAYNAENHITSVLKRIPIFILENIVEIYLIDDSSTDQTIEVAQNFEWASHYAPLKVFKTPHNQGYGGNQKIGYSYAIAENFDIVILLHGDGQYAPESLPLILSVYENNEVDAVFGSRFLNTFDAIRGGMPLYKYLGNRVLTSMQNAIMNSSLSEWHSGYRSYRTRVLKKIPFAKNSRDFDFDSEIIIQVLGSGGRIVEVAIPTFYGDEICHVNGLRYAIQCLKNVLQYRAMQFELFYDSRFDLNHHGVEETSGTRGHATTSLPHYVENIILSSHGNALLLGEKFLPSFSQKQKSVGKFQVIHETELDSEWVNNVETPVDIAFALDEVEHISNADYFISQVHSCITSHGVLHVSTPNVAFLPLRMMLLMGFFNYGRKGILDKTHQRLFTMHSFKRLLKQNGFQIMNLKGFGPPIASLRNGQSTFFNLIDKIAYYLANLWPSLFAYQFLITALREDDLKTLTQQTTTKLYFKDDV